MEAKSVSDCLNIFDCAKVEKIVGSSDLENIQKVSLEKGEVFSSKIGLLYQTSLDK